MNAAARNEWVELLRDWEVWLLWLALLCIFTFGERGRRKR